MSWDSAMLSLASSPVKGDVIEVFLSILRLLFHLKQAQSAGITTSLVHLESALELYQTKLVPILNRLSIPDKREVILWLPIQRDTDLQMIHFLGDILHLRKNEAGAIAEVKVPIEDLRMQISMLKVSYFVNEVTSKVTALYFLRLSLGKDLIQTR